MFGSNPMSPRKQALHHLKKAMLSMSYGPEEAGEDPKEEAMESPGMEASEDASESLNPASSAAKQAESEIMAPGGMIPHKENEGPDEELHNAKRAFMMGKPNPPKKVSSLMVAVSSPSKHPYGKRKK